MHYGKKIKKIQDKIWWEKFVINPKLDQIIKGKLSWYNLQPSVSPAVHYLQAVCFACLHALMRSNMAPLHGKENRLWHSTGEFFSPFIFADLWQFKVLWLIWSVPLTAMTQSSFPVWGCHVSLLVKTLQTKMKASTAACERWSKTSRFYSSALSLHHNHFFFFLFISLRSWKWHKIHIRSSVSICLAKFLHINLFGRNDKNQSARPAAYDCQVTQIQQ